jgi:hypothetical protein
VIISAIRAPATAEDLAPTSHTQERDDLVRSEAGTQSDGHLVGTFAFSSSNQLSTT